MEESGRDPIWYISPECASRNGEIHKKILSQDNHFPAKLWIRDLPTMKPEY